MIKEFLISHGSYSDEKEFKQLTSLKMGGRIAHYVEPFSFDDLKEIVCFLKKNKIAFKIIGNGSNLLCGSNDYNGVVISLKKFDKYELNNNNLYVEAGVLTGLLANVLAKMGFGGFEFASAIPGCIGGLVYMNAGAYKKEMADIVKEVLVLKGDELVWMTNEQCEFSYRHSVFQNHPHWVILACRIELYQDDKDKIIGLMSDRLERRKASQPLEFASAGSTFRNPEQIPAWQLIDGINMRGYKINGVEVSNKHSNFIVNTGQGSAEDYLKIAYKIIDDVKNKYNIQLVMEVEKFNC